MRKILRLAAVAGLLAAAFAAAPATTATAAIAPLGLYRVGSSSLNDSISPKSVSVSCNGTDKLTDVEGFVDGGTGQVLLTKAYAENNQHTATAQGYETIATTANWTVWVYGICTPATGIQHMTLVQKTFGATPDDKFVKAECEGSQVAYGGGWKLEDAAGDVAIDEKFFDTANQGVQITVYNFDTVGDYTLTAQVLCGDAIGTRTLLTHSSANNSITPKTDSPTACSGEVTGVGAITTGGIGNTSISMLRVKPNMQEAEVTVREIDAYTTNWLVESESLCLI